MLDKIKYPNPQMIRTSWLDLNGEWAFFIAKNESGYDKYPHSFPYQIKVPYSYTFKNAEVNEEKYYPVVWYQKKFDLTKDAIIFYTLRR